MIDQMIIHTKIHQCTKASRDPSCACKMKQSETRPPSHQARSPRPLSQNIEISSILSHQNSPGSRSPWTFGMKHRSIQRGASRQHLGIAFALPHASHAALGLSRSAAPGRRLASRWPRPEQDSWPQPDLLGEPTKQTPQCD